MQVDVLLLALFALHLNFLLAHAYFGRGDRWWPWQLPRIPLQLPRTLEELFASLVSLGVSAYFGRVLLAQHRLMPVTATPIDFLTADGLAINLAIGAVVLAAWSLVQATHARLLESFETWRWRHAAVA